MCMSGMQPDPQPECRSVIPNVLPSQDTAAASVQSKQVWRLVFFSRLEERKGIKLFVEAVSRLQPESLDKRCVSQTCLVHECTVQGVWMHRCIVRGV